MMTPGEWQKEQPRTMYAAGSQIASAIHSPGMSVTTQKHRNFVSEPMGEKDVIELAGIGPVLGDRLMARQYNKAYIVLGQYLVCKKDETLFKEWLCDVTGANSKQQNDCFLCLKEWCASFL